MDPESIELPSGIIDSEGDEASTDALKGKYVGIYFSARWGPPCRAFTPKLVEFRNREAENGFEVLWVSFDKSSEERVQFETENQMSWPSLEGISSKQGRALAKSLGVEAIPTLVILDPNGKVVTKDGYAQLNEDPESAWQRWKGILPGTRTNLGQQEAQEK